MCVYLCTVQLQLQLHLVISCLHVSQCRASRHAFVASTCSSKLLLTRLGFHLQQQVLTWRGLGVIVLGKIFQELRHALDCVLSSCPSRCRAERFCLLPQGVQNGLYFVDQIEAGALLLELPMHEIRLCHVSDGVGKVVVVLWNEAYEAYCSHCIVLHTCMTAC